MSEGVFTGGSLKLKGGSVKSPKKRRKKNKKVILNEFKKATEDEMKRRDEDEEQKDELPGEIERVDDTTLTEAQRKHLSARERQENAKIKEAASKAYREKVKEFNEFLDNLTEHYDIPKVGPG